MELNDEIVSLKFIVENLKPNNCILCGTDKDVTKHHLCFNRLKVRLVECSSRGSKYVPLCLDCHDKIEHLKKCLTRKK